MCGGGGPGGDDGTADQDETAGFENVTDTSGVSAETSGGVSSGGNDPTGNTSGKSSQVSSVEVDPGYPSVGLSQAAINSAKTDRSQSKDSQSFFASDAVPDAMDFNFANSQAAQNVRDNKDKGSVFRDPQNPFSYAINDLSKIGPQNTYNNLNKGQVPSYTNGMITGTTGQGFGMASGPGSPNPYGSVPGYDVFDTNSPSMGMYGGPTDIGGNEGDGQQIIRRNPSDPVQDDPTDPILSDELASDYLQNPYYLYSGIGNQYQPYGYAQNTLVDLLRTRNMTQPQQRAANLGLFGNPGDFS